MQNSLIAIITLLFFIPAMVSAEAPATKPVSFEVELGDLVCKDGIGTASVLFITNPKEGGYFDIIGEPIDQNRITLDRRIAFKSGKYTWKGIPNGGYHEVPPSIGEFVIPECTASSPAVSPIAPAKKQSAVTPAVKEKGSEPTRPQEIKTATTTEITAASSSEPLKTEVPEAGRGAAFKWIILGLVVLGIWIGSFAWKKPTK